MRRLLLCLLLLCAAPGLARAADLQFPQLTGRVTDAAGVLDAGTVSALESLLADHEAKTGEQVVVATIPDLQGNEIADYGYQLGRRWGIGQKGKSNGALLIVAPHERQVRIEVGYGLEGVLTDAISRMVIDQLILPRFRAGDLPGGIVAGTRGILTALGDPAHAPENLQQQAQPDASAEGQGLPLWVIILIVIVFLMLRRRGGGLGILPFIGGGWGGRGGGGGGFSGGGGDFGGGGSSGRW